MKTTGYFIFAQSTPDSSAWALYCDPRKRDIGTRCELLDRNDPAGFGGRGGGAYVEADAVDVGRDDGCEQLLHRSVQQQQQVGESAGGAERWARTWRTSWRRSG